MKRFIYALSIAIVATSSLLSCGSDNDNDAVALSSDCYISSFTIGTLRRAITTIDENGDSVKGYVTFSGAYYPLTIDHLAGTITNREPLPMGTQLTAALATITAQGTVVYTPDGEITDSTVWVAYASTDSIDFSQPLLFRAYAYDGSGYRSYHLSLSVRTAEAGSYTWQQLPNLTTAADITAEKLLLRADSLVAFYTTNAGELRRASCPLVSPTAWVDSPTDAPAGVDCQTIQQFAAALWATTAEGTLLKSEDGLQWAAVEQEEVSTRVQLLAASATQIYARITRTDANDSGVVAASVDGTHWLTITLDSNPDLFPTANITSVAYTQKNGNRRVLLGGIGTAEGNVPVSTTWSLRENSSEPFALFATSNNSYALTYTTPRAIVAYRDRLIAVGDDIRVSYDNGINWSTEEQLTLPFNVDVAVPISATADANHIYVAHGTQLWSATLNE